MRRQTLGVLIGSLFVLASTVPAMAQAEPSDEAPTRTVAIPGSGAVAILPRGWRTWQREEYDAARRQGPGLWTTDVDTGWTCHFRASTDLVSAEAAADGLVEAPEAADIGISRSEPFEVPVGTAVLVTLGSPEAPQPPSSIQHEAFVDAPQGVIDVFCGAAPADFLRDVTRTIAPLPLDYVPEPFDPRVALADPRVAVDFGPEWTVGFRSPASYTGGPTVLWAQRAISDEDGTPLDSCSIEDVSSVPGFQGLATRKDAKAAFIATAEGRRGRELTTAVVELPSGPAIRADWPRRGGMPTTAWVLSDAHRVIVLWCRSTRPPEDDWRSIAETIEFLPRDE